MRVGDQMQLDGTPEMRSLTGPGWSGDIDGVKLIDRGDSLVGGGNYVVGKVDQSAPGWFRQRDQLVGRKLAAGGPGDAFVSGLALLDCDLGLPLKSHADDARGSGQTWVVGRGVADDVGDLDRGDHAELKGLDDVGKVETAGELVWCRPSSSTRGGRRDSSPDFPQRFAMRFHAIWLASRDGASRWITSTSIWPFMAAASVRLLVVLVISACTPSVSAAVHTSSAARRSSRTTPASVSAVSASIR